MGVPFRKVNPGEDAGVAGFLKIEQDGERALRGALFIVDPRGEPVEFAYSRVTVGHPLLWRVGDARRSAVAALVQSLFQAARAVPTVILTRADEIPDGVFGDRIECLVPLARVDETVRLEETLRPDGVAVVWSEATPADTSPGRLLLELLARRDLLMEPFERASAGLAAAFPIDD